jgi:hypothetical protein
MDPEPSDAAAGDEMPSDAMVEETTDVVAMDPEPSDAAAGDEMPSDAMVEETTDVAATVADFVEPGMDISTYVDRYLHDKGFSAWYDQWYPDLAFHAALGITQAEYQDIVDDLTAPVECGPGTALVDGECVPAGSLTSKAPSVSAAEAFETQGEGLQLGVAAAGAFGVAVGVVLFLWLPSRIRKRWAARHQATKE